jgi:polysaccharide export outer membrane protein
MEVIRMARRFSSEVMVLLLLGIGAPVFGAEEQSPPKELVQYIRQAKGQGVADAKIRQQALAVGWPAALVDTAIASEKDAKGPKPGDPAGVEAKFEAPAAPIVDLQAAAPPAPAPPALVAGNAVPSPAAADDYQIGAGDTLQVSVWKEPEASVPSAVVRPDGRITMPLIKEVGVAGLTPRQAEKVITEGLGKFITDANVTVVVAAMSSKKVYVLGAVRREGPLPYTYGMSVMQALSEAGGLTDYAKRSKIYILRTESGREYRMDFNYNEAIRGIRMEQNIVLLPSDTVVIPN